jgi:hypothetical protein
MIIKIQFAEETCFVARIDVPNRKIIRDYTHWPSGIRLALRALAMTEQPKPCED